MENIKIVLAEDHLIVRKGLKNLLEEETGIQVIGEASDGREAIEVVETLQPDLLIADIRMPGMSGLELAERVSATPAPPPVVLMSGFATPEMDPNTLRRLAVRFLPKPFTPDELESVVRQVVATKPA